MNIPKMERVPDNASFAEREEAYRRYCLLLVELNPSFFLPIGVVKRWWHFFKIEHPLTKR